MNFKPSATFAGGSKLFSRTDVNPRLDFHAGMDVADFLGRLWRLFGPASPRDDGFSYNIEHVPSGRSFEAYSGASGPSYGGDYRDSDALKPILVELEALLDATAPADCEFELELDIDYGGGRITIGCKDGKPFRRAVPRSPVTGATTDAERLAMATERGTGYGIEAGWQLCLDEVIDAPDDDAFVGFTLNDKGVPVFLFDPGAGIEERPIDPKQLSEEAASWLASYEKWRKKKPGKKRR
jgi:hypothetical protein